MRIGDFFMKKNDKVFIKLWKKNNFFIYHVFLNEI
jgi:hypothetical protein